MQDKTLVKLCKCGNQRRQAGRHCLSCHAAATRKYREQKKPITLEQRLKLRARWYSRKLVHRGTLKKQPCENCGSSQSQMHHPDYSNPKIVNWFCRACHLKVHHGR